VSRCVLECVVLEERSRCAKYDLVSNLAKSWGKAKSRKVNRGEPSHIVKAQRSRSIHGKGHQREQPWAS
jgi:hypothetical protein